jgi:hypothetical protein
MHSRAISYAAREHLLDLDYAISHLEPDPVGAQFAPDAEAARAALETKKDDWTAADRAVATAQAGLVIAEENLSNAARKARAGILDDVHYKRDARKVVTYLPHGLTAVTAVPFLEEVGAVRLLAAHCAQDRARWRRRPGPLVTAADEARQRTTGAGMPWSRRRRRTAPSGGEDQRHRRAQIAHRSWRPCERSRQGEQLFRSVARPNKCGGADQRGGGEAGTVILIATESPANCSP